MHSERVGRDQVLMSWWSWGRVGLTGLEREQGEEAGWCLDCGWGVGPGWALVRFESPTWDVKVPKKGLYHQLVHMWAQEGDLGGA